MSNDALRRQAERFLAFALKAREAGNLPLADELTARAMDLFNKADSTVDVGTTSFAIDPRSTSGTAATTAPPGAQRRG